MGATWRSTSDTPENGQRVELQLHGDDQTYRGICVRPRKLWVELEDHPVPGFVADEVTIVRWRVTEAIIETKAKA